MTFGSLFSGSGSMDVACEESGMTCLWQVEKDRACNRLLDRYWPDVRRYDDITTIDLANLEAVDFVIGGDPCPFRSKARSMQRSSSPDLWPEFLRVVQSLRPLWVLREHVVASDTDACWADLCRLGYTAVVLDCDSAEITGQSRPREYLCGVLESTGICPGRVFSQPKSRSRPDSPFDQTVPIARCLTTHNKRYDSRDNYVLEQEYGVRILSPEERERLQGLQPGWTGGLPPRTRARMTGNAATKPLVAWIARRIVNAGVATS